MAYELALSGAELRAAIGFHSGLSVTSPGSAAAIKGKVLTMVGADDPSIPAEAREAFGRMLGEAKVDYTMTVYGGVVHSFTDPGLRQASAAPSSPATTPTPTGGPGRR